MVAGNISSEKIDLLIYGPSRPILENGFSDQFVLHPFETKHDLERLNSAVAAKIRGAAVTYHTVHARQDVAVVVSETRDRRELRRRLTITSIPLTPRTQYRRHQTPRMC